MRLNWRALGEVAVGELAGPLARLAAALGVLELVGAEAELAGAAVDERVAEARDVAGGLPDGGVEDDRGVEGDDVVALLHHRLEPERADVVLRQDAVVAVVVRRAEPAVDLGGGEDEAAPPAERHDLVHRDLGHGFTVSAWRRLLRLQQHNGRESVSRCTSTSTTRRPTRTASRPRRSSASTRRGSSRRSS